MNNLERCDCILIVSSKVFPNADTRLIDAFSPNDLFRIRVRFIVVEHAHQCEGETRVAGMGQASANTALQGGREVDVGTHELLTLSSPFPHFEVLSSFCVPYVPLHQPICSRQGRKAATEIIISTFGASKTTRYR
uniref:Uncharacterized protein n=1 Tax=Craspedostauros australis TaxID=1486917 RepID=A0A7R9WS83_9STRA